MTTKTQQDASGLDDLDPLRTPARDAIHFRAILEAADSLRAAEDLVRLRVREARAAGDSWTIVGAALGISKQAAQQRFGRS